MFIGRFWAGATQECPAFERVVAIARPAAKLRMHKNRQKSEEFALTRSARSKQAEKHLASLHGIWKLSNPIGYAREKFGET